LGLLFQIQDDIIDETHTDEEAGKPTGNDGDKELIYKYYRSSRECGGGRRRMLAIWRRPDLKLLVEDPPFWPGLAQLSKPN